MKHFKKEELTTGFCVCCESHVEDLVKGKKICTGCLELTQPGEILTDEDGEDNGNDDW